VIEAVYFGNLIPLIFLIVVIKGEYRKLLLFFTWGLTSAILIYAINLLIDRFFPVDETVFIIQLIPFMEELIKILPILFLLKNKRAVYKFNIIRFAMAAGIGFSILENYLYLSMLPMSPAGGTILFIILRSTTACLLHGATSSLIGFSLQLMHNYSFFSFSLFIGTYLLSGTIHSLYNFFGLMTEYQLFIIILPTALFLIEIYIFNFFGRKHSSPIFGSEEKAGGRHEE